MSNVGGRSRETERDKPNNNNTLNYRERMDGYQRLGGWRNGSNSDWGKKKEREKRKKELPL